MDGQSRRLGFSHDANGNRTAMTWPDSYAVTYDHDGLDRMTAIREGGATSGPGVLAQLRYDAEGRRERLTRGNGAITEYGYDGVSRLQRLRQDLAGTAYDVTFTYDYNPASQIVRRGGDNDLYAHSAIGNGAAASPADGLNRMTALGATPLSYDARGNQTTDGTNGLLFSSENLLTGKDRSIASGRHALAAQRVAPATGVKSRS